MSVEITTAMVEQFKANFEMLSQQKGSRLRNAVRLEEIKGEFKYIDQIGEATAQKKTSRHQDTPLSTTPHRRRQLTPVDYIWADLIDDEDKIRTLGDPTNDYLTAGVNAMGRAIDDEIIEAATGTAYTGRRGATAIALPSTQKVAVDLGGASIGLTIAKLIAAKGLLWKGDVDEDEELFICVAGKQLEDLLNDSTVTSIEYNSVKALVNGKIDTFMGFKFIRSQRLTLNATTDVRTCFAWAKSGIALGIGADIHTEISKRSDKNYATQTWAAMTVASTRMEEVKVVEISCDESP